MEIETAAPAPAIPFPATPPTTFWERFEFATLTRAEDTFTDRFHALNTLNWQGEMASRQAAEFRDHSTRVAHRALTHSVSTGFREAAFDLPLAFWLKENRGFFADLLLRTVDTADEAAVAPLNPDYRARERSWWQQLSASRDFRYGLRPFRTSPYAFVSGSVWSGDSLLVLAHLRYHYRQFAEHQFEFALSLPVSHGYAIDLGTAYHLERNGEAKRLVLKLSKEFATGGLVHVGLETREHPRFQVGMTMPL
jgi:hypothetical protein